MNKIYYVVLLAIAAVFFFLGSRGVGEQLGALPGQALTQNATSTVTVNTTTTLLIAARPQRAEVTVCNTGSNVMWINPSFGASAQVNGPGRLNANGGCATFDASNRWVGPIYGIADSSATTTAGTYELW